MKSGIHTTFKLGKSSEEDTTVGALLRSRRLRQGENLEQIAKVLRIKHSYLQAIENNQHEDLPGTIYATGFIRTYAEYLGFEGEQIIKKVKAEVNELTESPKLVFPSLIPEDGIPGGAVVVIGLLIACLGYFTWYWTTSSDYFVADSVPTIPKELAKETNKQPVEPSLTANNTLVEASSAVAATTETPQTTSPNNLTPKQHLSLRSGFPKTNRNADENATAPDTPKILANELTQAETTIKKGKLPLANPRSQEFQEKIVEEKENLSTVSPLEPENADTNRPPGNQLALQKIDKIIPNETSTEVNPRKEISLDTEANKIPIASNNAAKPNPVQAAFDDNVPDTLTNLPDRENIQIAALPNAASRLSERVRIVKPSINNKPPLAFKKDSRIKIIAKNTSWIQLRNIRENRIILSKVLPTGQSYNVPNIKYLSLMTGNAGALKITVDGKTVPNIGKLGEVRRKILMEPESLKLGRAVVE